MRRRKFIALLGGTAIVWPYVVIAQQTDRMRKIGVLANEPWSAIDGLRQGLRELGYIEGHNLRLEYRYAEGQTERYPALAAELVALPVDAIVTTGTPAALAAKRATTTIPIVMATGGDPVGTGAVSNFGSAGWQHHGPLVAYVRSRREAVRTAEGGAPYALPCRRADEPS